MKILSCYLSVLVLTIKIAHAGDSIKLDVIYEKVNFQDISFSELKDKLPYPINNDGTLKEPEALMGLLLEVGINNLSELNNGPEAAKDFFIKASGDPDNLESIIYVFIYTDIIKKLRETNRLNDILKAIVKTNLNYYNQNVSKGFFQMEFERIRLINWRVLSHLFVLTPFFSTDEFLVKYLLSLTRTSLGAFVKSHTDLVKIFFISSLVNKTHIIELLDCTHDNFSGTGYNCDLFMKKRDFLYLLQFICKKEQFSLLCDYLYFLTQRKIYLLDTKIFESSYKLSRKDIIQVAGRPIEYLPNKVKGWLEKYFLA